MQAGFGLVAGVDLVGSLLEEERDQGVGGLEERHAQQQFEFPHRKPIGMVAAEALDQVLDFGVLGKDKLGASVSVFFFERAAISARVLATDRSTYSSMS